MIDIMGLEAFTFKKLATEIGSTEATIYRYFENKHRMLVYLITWYWAWIDYRIEFETHNLSDPELALERALKIITERKKQDNTFPDIDEEALHRIVISEADKTYLTKHVDENNRDGLFRGYKSVCKNIAFMIKTINPAFAYPHALVSTVMVAANQQIFFAQHIPTLTEVSESPDPFQTNYQLLKHLVFSSIKQ